MSLSVDVFWSFRSPYSYLVMSKLRALQEEIGRASCRERVYVLV